MNAIQSDRLLEGIEKNKRAITAEIFSWKSGDCFFYSKEDLRADKSALGISLLEISRMGIRASKGTSSLFFRQLEMNLLVVSETYRVMESLAFVARELSPAENEVVRRIAQGSKASSFVKDLEIDDPQEREEIFCASYRLEELGIISKESSPSFDRSGGRDAQGGNSSEQLYKK
jgi:hypothetical protein